MIVITLNSGKEIKLKGIQIDDFYFILKNRLDGFGFLDLDQGLIIRPDNVSSVEEFDDD